MRVYCGPSDRAWQCPIRQKLFGPTVCTAFQRLFQSPVTRSGLRLIRNGGHSPRVFQTLHNLSDTVSWAITVPSLAPESIQKRKGEPTDLPSEAPSLHSLPFSMRLFHRYYCVIKLISKDSLPNSSTMRAEESRSPPGWRNCKERDTSIRREGFGCGLKGQYVVFGGRHPITEFWYLQY